jgi:hypothetical protein
VQTEEQYVFVHDALLEATLSGNTEICRENLSKFVEKLLTETEEDAATQKRFIDQQFEVKKSLCTFYLLIKVVL